MPLVPWEELSAKMVGDGHGPGTPVYEAKKSEYREALRQTDPDAANQFEAIPEKGIGGAFMTGASEGTLGRLAQRGGYMDPRKMEYAPGWRGYAESVAEGAGQMASEPWMVATPVTGPAGMAGIMGATGVARSLAEGRKPGQVVGAGLKGAATGLAGGVASKIAGATAGPVARLLEKMGVSQGVTRGAAEAGGAAAGLSYGGAAAEEADQPHGEHETAMDVLRRIKSRGDQGALVNLGLMGASHAALGGVRSLMSRGHAEPNVPPPPPQAPPAGGPTLSATPAPVGADTMAGTLPSGEKFQVVDTPTGRKVMGEDGRIIAEMPGAEPPPPAETTPPVAEAPPEAAAPPAPEPTPAPAPAAPGRARAIAEARRRAAVKATPPPAPVEAAPPPEVADQPPLPAGEEAPPAAPVEAAPEAPPAPTDEEAPLPPLAPEERQAMLDRLLKRATGKKEPVTEWQRPQEAAPAPAPEPEPDLTPARRIIEALRQKTTGEPRPAESFPPPPIASMRQGEPMGRTPQNILDSIKEHYTALNDQQRVAEGAAPLTPDQKAHALRVMSRLAEEYHSLSPLPAEVQDVVAGHAPAWMRPSPAEGTVPTAGERAMEGQDLQQIAKQHNLQYFQGKDGSEYLINPLHPGGRYTPEQLRQLDAQGKLPEIVNGEGTAPKPADASMAVTARDPTGQEIRTVLTNTPEQTWNAVKAQPSTAKVEIRPAKTQIPKLLEQRRQAAEIAARARMPQGVAQEGPVEGPRGPLQTRSEETPTVPPPIPREAPVRRPLEYADVVAMRPEQLRSAAEEEAARDQRAAEEVFGARAAEYERAFRAANSPDPARADAASRQVEAMEAGLTPVQQQRLFGIGESGYNAEELHGIADAAEHATPAYLVHEPVAHLLNTVGRELLTGDPATDAISSIRLQGALRELGRRGETQEVVLRAVRQRAAREGVSLGDAEELLRGRLQDLRSTRRTAAEIATRRRGEEGVFRPFARKPKMVVPKALDPEIERMFKPPKEEPGYWDRLGERMLNMQKMWEKHFKLDPEFKDHPEFQNALRLEKDAVEVYSHTVREQLDKVVGKLSTEEYEMLRREVILHTLYESVQAGHDIPGGKTAEQVKAELDQLEPLQTTAVKEALQEHRKLMWEKALREVQRGTLDPRVLLTGTYYPMHAVETSNILADIMPNLPEQLKTPFRAWARKRDGSVTPKDFDYYKVMHSHLMRGMIADGRDDFAMKWLPYWDAAPKMTDVEKVALFGARQDGKPKDMGPHGKKYPDVKSVTGKVGLHAPFQFRPFTWDMVVPKTPENTALLDGIARDYDTYVKHVPRYLVPAEVFERFQSFTRPSTITDLERAFRHHITGWKRMAIDSAGLTFNVVNAAGDIAQLWAHDAAAVKNLAMHFPTMIQMARGKATPKAPADLMRIVREQQIGNSAFFTAEHWRRIQQMGALERARHPIDVPLSYLEYGMNVRESTVRMAKAWTDYQRMLRGEPPRVKFINLDGMSPESALGKAGREFAHDYGKISPAMQGIVRQALFPFAPWFADMFTWWPKYAIGKHSLEGAVKFGTIAAAMFYWNNYQVPDAERKISTWQKGLPFHLTIPWLANKDGAPLVLAFPIGLDVFGGVVGMHQLIKNLGEYARNPDLKKSPHQIMRKVLDPPEVLGRALDQMGQLAPAHKWMKALVTNKDPDTGEPIAYEPRLEWEKEGYEAKAKWLAIQLMPPINRMFQSLNKSSKLPPGPGGLRTSTSMTGRFLEALVDGPAWPFPTYHPDPIMGELANLREELNDQEVERARGLYQIEESIKGEGASPLAKGTQQFLSSIPDIGSELADPRSAKQTLRDVLTQQPPVVSGEDVVNRFFTTKSLPALTRILQAKNWNAATPEERERTRVMLQKIVQLRRAESLKQAPKSVRAPALQQYLDRQGPPPR